MIAMCNLLSFLLRSLIWNGPIGFARTLSGPSQKSQLSGCLRLAHLAQTIRCSLQPSSDTALFHEFKVTERHMKLQSHLEVEHPSEMGNRFSAIFQSDFIPALHKAQAILNDRDGDL